MVAQRIYPARNLDLCRGMNLGNGTRLADRITLFLTRSFYLFCMLLQWLWYYRGCASFVESPFVRGTLYRALLFDDVQLHCQPRQHLPLGPRSPRASQVFRNRRRSTQRYTRFLLCAHGMVVCEEAPRCCQGWTIRWIQGLGYEEEGPHRGRSSSRQEHVSIPARASRRRWWYAT